MNLRDLLLEYKWNHAKKPMANYLEITFIHRGAPNDEKTILYQKIKEIKKKFLVIELDNTPTYIPLHRIKKIINQNTRKVIYVKKSKNLFDK